MAPIKVGNRSVEIAVNNIEGFIHELIDVPMKNGFWIVFTIKNEDGKSESFPFVDDDHKIRIYDSYADALHDAALKLMKTKKADGRFHPSRTKKE